MQSIINSAKSYWSKYELFIEVRAKRVYAVGIMLINS